MQFPDFRSVDDRRRWPTLSVAPSEGAIMAAPDGAKAPLVEGSEDARSTVRSL